VTLRQNLHQFQAEENARNAASDKAFSRTGPQNDPLEGGKILLIYLESNHRGGGAVAIHSTCRRVLSRYHGRLS
jgi:hypothetical protein